MDDYLHHNIAPRIIIDNFTFLLFSHLADAFIQSDLQIRKSNYNYKLKLYKYYIDTFKKLNKMTNAYNNISKLNI